MCTEKLGWPNCLYFLMVKTNQIFCSLRDVFNKQNFESQTIICIMVLDFLFLLINHPTFYFSSGCSSCACLLYSCFLWSPYCFLITNLGMLAFFHGSCHGDRWVPSVGHFRHNLQMLCQMQVVHTGTIRQGRAQRWDAELGHCLQLDRRQVRHLLCLV